MLTLDVKGRREGLTNDDSIAKNACNKGQNILGKEIKMYIYIFWSVR